MSNGLATISVAQPIWNIIFYYILVYSQIYIQNNDILLALISHKTLLYLLNLTEIYNIFTYYGLSRASIEMISELL